jgi:hypothetical protein
LKSFTNINKSLDDWNILCGFYNYTSYFIAKAANNKRRINLAILSIAELKQKIKKNFWSCRKNQQGTRLNKEIKNLDLHRLGCKVRSCG